MRREFAERYKDEMITVSCDGMNKLNVGGGMMVSRYHQINRIFMIDDSPDYEDHDFNLPGYKVCISGYMSLEFNDHEPVTIQATSDDSFTEVDFNINEDPFEVFLQKREKEDIKTLLNDVMTAVETGSKAIGENKLLKDAHGRVHLRTPQSGPAFLAVHPMKYQQSNIASHLSDLENVLSMPQHKNKSSVLLTVDGGPDWTTTSLINIYFFYSFWRKKELTLLTITSYAPGFSAYNSVEHLWPLVSKKFISAKANPCMEGDEVPPVQLSDATVEQIVSKEYEVFDRITNEICDYYLKKFTFNGRDVLVQQFPCNFVGVYFGEKGLVEEFLKSGMKKAREDPKFKLLRADFKDLLHHIDRRKYEVTFFKCDACSKCLEYETYSKNVLEFMNAHNKLHFESRPSLHLKDNFMTFLEQEQYNIRPSLDAGLPSKEKSNVGACDTCRSWNFNSKTECDRHYQMFHERKHPVLPNAKNSNASPASSK